MLRIVLLVIRLLWKIPYWTIKLKQIENLEKYDRMTRYNYIRKFIDDVIKRSNVEIVCTGLENLPAEDGYLVTPNHQGLFDPLILAHTHERNLSAVVKIELTKVPYIKNIINALPAFPMDRSNLRASMKIIREVSKELEAKHNFVIFPEGTRSKKGNQLLEFKGGTFKSATDKKVPIVPVALVDCFKPFDSKSIKKVTCQVHYLEPIYYDEYKDLTSIELAKEVETRIQNKINSCI